MEYHDLRELFKKIISSEIDDPKALPPKPESLSELFEQFKQTITKIVTFDLRKPKPLNSESAVNYLHNLGQFLKLSDEALLMSLLYLSAELRDQIQDLLPIRIYLAKEISDLVDFFKHRRLPPTDTVTPHLFLQQPLPLFIEFVKSGPQMDKNIKELLSDARKEWSFIFN